MGVRTIFGWLCGFVFLSIALPCTAEEAIGDDIVVRYPLTSERDTRLEYFYDLLKVALDESGAKYSLVPSQNEMTNARKKLSLQSGQISVMWTAAQQELEGKLRAVPVPIFAGFMGYRLFVTHKNLQAELQKITTVDELKKFTMGQGIGWISSDILLENGFKVEKAAYESLFKMINYERIDLYPRGMQEAYPEVKARVADLPNIVVARNIGIYHPIVVMFYVNRSDDRLYQALKKGLDALYRSGKFKQFFMGSEVFKAMNEELDFDSVNWIKLENNQTPGYLRDIAEEYYDMFHVRDAYEREKAQ